MRGRKSIIFLVAMLAGGLFGVVSQGKATNDPFTAPQVTSQVPAPQATGAISTINDTTTEQTMKKAMFGAGCFWGIEAKFRRIPGVIDAPVGYSGGSVDNPTYRMVCSGTTGHAEVVEVTYDPTVVTYEQLLDAFWKMHDPTQLNRQGPDVGTQYRSVIFTYDDDQLEKARASKAALMASSPFFQTRPIVTEITPASTFWRAEEYHQRYLEKRGLAQCH